MEKLDIRKPYDGSLIDTISIHGRQEAENRLVRASQLYSQRDGWLEKSFRIVCLERLARLLEGQTEYLARQISNEGGKPLRDAMIEVERGIQGVKIAIAEMSLLAGKEIPMGLGASSKNHLAYTCFEPRGVVLAISAFNHPFNLMIHQLIPAIASGCPVLVKPDLRTPLSCLSLLALIEEAGYPKAWCQEIVCSNEVAAEIAADPRLALVSFVGSAKVGWGLRSRLAPGVACLLEHGGVAPVIIDKSADMDLAVNDVKRAAFYHCGQVCVSTQRVFVDQRMKNAFTQKLADEVKSLVVGDPLELSTDVGPLISSSELDRIHHWVMDAVANGATLVCGGKRFSSTLYEPTILLNPKQSAKVSHEEIFGPVVAIYSYRDLGEAVRLANSVPYVFQAAVYSQDIDVALKISRQLNGVSVMINQHTAFRTDWMPFGGARLSGLGMGGIGQTIREMCLERMFVIRSSGLD
jgi:acyl-CoA reductase-like NAD-dependent aldehyde dehydrogenase